MSDSEQEEEPQSPSSVLEAADSENVVDEMFRQCVAHHSAVQKQIQKRVALFIAIDGHSFEVVEGQGFKEMMSHCRPYSENHPLLPFFDSGIGNSEEDAAGREERFRKSIARFLVIDGHPTEVVEGKGFNLLMSYCFPKFTLPSALTLSEICDQLYLDEKLKLKEFMKTNCQSVCLTTDTWKSPQGIIHMGITAHFIDEEWKLQRKVLSFLPNPLSPSDEIGEQIEACLDEWGIKKVLTISMDESSSDDDAIAYLKEKLTARGSVFLGCKYLQLKCIVQMMNSVVVQALKEARSSVSRVRDLVRYMMCDGPQKKFKECAEAEIIESKDGLNLDFNHMWNSTYVMLCRAEKYEKVFEKYEKLDPDIQLAMEDGLPSSEDWSVVRELAIFLKPFYNITMKYISESSLFTSGNYWVDVSDLYAIFSEWEKGSELQAIAKRMRLKLEEHFGGYEKMNKIVYIATVLDPRSKFKVLEYAFAQIYGEEKGVILLKNVKEAMSELFDEYKTMLQVAEDQSFSGSNEDQRSELETYLNKPTEDDGGDFEILEWWKCNSEKFPILSHMAREILAIPKSAVRPDHAFNTKGPMLDESKGYLDYEILQALMCAQDWLRTSPPYFDIVKGYEEDEMLDEESEPDIGSSWSGGSDGD